MPIHGAKKRVAAESRDRTIIWKEHLYAYREKKALKFSSTREADKAIDLIWKTSELYGMPRAVVDADTIIVPEEAVRFFQAAGLKFKRSRVVPAGELGADEIARLRRDQAIF